MIGPHSKTAVLEEELRRVRLSEADLRASGRQLEAMFADKVSNLRGAAEQQVRLLEDSLRSAEGRLGIMTELRDEAVRALHRREEEGARERSELQAGLGAQLTALTAERDDLLAQREAQTRLVGELTAKVGAAELAGIEQWSRAKEGEIAALVEERETLLGIIAAQDKDQDSAQRVSQASLRMLQHRQAALDEGGYGDEFTDGVLRLQDSLQSLLDREGGILQAEMMDAK